MSEGLSVRVPDAVQRTASRYAAPGIRNGVAE
jgi:hypothetical protein